ncbi:hypothetical protein [Azospirillum palustre]
MSPTGPGESRSIGKATGPGIAHPRPRDAGTAHARTTHARSAGQRIRTKAATGDARITKAATGSRHALVGHSGRTTLSKEIPHPSQSPRVVGVRGTGPLSASRMGQGRVRVFPM